MRCRRTGWQRSPCPPVPADGVEFVDGVLPNLGFVEGCCDARQFCLICCRTWGPAGTRRFCCRDAGLGRCRWRHIVLASPREPRGRRALGADNPVPLRVKKVGLVQELQNGAKPGPARPPLVVSPAPPCVRRAAASPCARSPRGVPLAAPPARMITGRGPGARGRSSCPAWSAGALRAGSAQLLLPVAQRM